MVKLSVAFSLTAYFTEVQGVGLSRHDKRRRINELKLMVGRSKFAQCDPRLY